MYFLPLRVIRCPVVLFASFSAMLESLVLRFFRFPHAPIPVFHPLFVSISYSRFSGTSKEFHKRKLKFIEKQLIIHAKWDILDTLPCKMTSLETHCSRIFSNSFCRKSKEMCQNWIFGQNMDFEGIQKNVRYIGRGFYFRGFCVVMILAPDIDESLHCFLKDWK